MSVRVNIALTIRRVVFGDDVRDIDTRVDKCMEMDVCCWSSQSQAKGRSCGCDRAPTSSKLIVSN